MLPRLLAFLLALLLLGELLLFPSCAAAYRPIHAPATIAQDAMHETTGLDYAYRLDVLTLSRNKKYAKKEPKTAFRVVALQITNRTSETIKVRDNVQVYIGGDKVTMVDAHLVKTQLKQIVPIYLLYGLIVITLNDCTGPNCDPTVVPVGLAIALGNMLLASNANKTFERDLMVQNLIDREIEPGETATGLLGVYSLSMGNLSLELVE